MNDSLAFIMGALVFACVVTLIRVIVGPAPATTLRLAPTPTNWRGFERRQTHPISGDRQTDPVIGWRSWSLRQGFSESGHTTTWVLTSPAMSMVEWPPRAAMRATCHTGCRDAPARQCRCGLYAIWPESFNGGLAGGVVVGEIKGWGRVIEHQEGWRAASAYPSSLCLVCDRCLLEGRWTRADWVGFGSQPDIPVANVRSVRAALIALHSNNPVGMCDRHWDRHAKEGPNLGGHVHSADDVTARLLADYGVKEAAPPGVSFSN
jgi:hypothetical protein